MELPTTVLTALGLLSVCLDVATSFPPIQAPTPAPVATRCAASSGALDAAAIYANSGRIKNRAPMAATLGAETRRPPQEIGRP